MFPILTATLMLPTPGRRFLFEGLDCTTSIPLDSREGGDDRLGSAPSSGPVT